VEDRLRALCEGRPIVVFDLETTGADRNFDRIVELAAVKIAPGEATVAYVKRVHPGVRIPREATAVHGISDEDVRDLPSFAVAAPEVVAFFAGCDLAGYNVRQFDLPVLVRECDRAACPFPLEGRRVIDAQTIFFKKEPRDLAAAVRLFAGREHAHAHDALSDVVATAEVLVGELARYDDLPKGLDALHAFSAPSENRYVDPDKRFFWRDGEAVFAFGDHRGRSLAEVAEKSPGYLDWMLRRDFPEEAKRIARDALKGVFPSRS
jgi:DNA polymerase-3 subunit epsilon